MVDYTLALNLTYYSALILAYMILVTIVGYCRALIAKWMGDDTAEQQGFLSLNPMVHIDTWGLTLLIFFHYFFNMLIGWGQTIPVNPSNIHGPWRWLKISCAMLSGALLYFLIASLGLLALGFKRQILVSSEYSATSVDSLFLLLITLCLFLAFIELIFNLFRLGSLVDQSKSWGHRILYIALTIPLIYLVLRLISSCVLFFVKQFFG